MYVPLRVHGHHSMLTGVDAPRDLVARARDLGLPALALADVDNLAGLVDFLVAVRDARDENPELALHPIVGAEISASRSASEPTASRASASPIAGGSSSRSRHAVRASASGDSSRAGAELGESRGRLVALVRNEVGYRNLCKLVSARHLGADPGDPREDVDLEIDPADRFDLVRAAIRYQEGLIYLVDDPRLLAQLAGRIDTRWLFAAVTPAALAKGVPASPTPYNRLRPWSAPPLAKAPPLENGSPTPPAPPSRNTHLDAAEPAPDAARLAARSARIVRIRPDSSTGPDDREAGRAGSRALDAGGDADEPANFDTPKTPPPARSAAAAELVLAARAFGVALVAVPDVYWSRPGGVDDHRVRVAIKHNALASDLPAAWCAEEPAHLLSFREVCALYSELEDVSGPWPATAASQPAEHAPCAAAYAVAISDTSVPPMVARTLLIASECRYVPELGGVAFPEVELEGGETPYSKLCELAFAGARARYQPMRPEVVRRLDGELAAIEKLGFAPYFLLVDRIADFARREEIPFVGRGSAAASLVSYCLGFTDADPLRYRLPFERFLNPTRTDRPDVDLDFCWRRRDEVIDFVYAAFGKERTAMICTLNTFGLRSAFREVALTEGLPPAEIQRWSRYLPWHLPHSDAATPFAGSADDEPANGMAEPPLPLASSGGAPHPSSSGADDAIAQALRETPECRDFPFGHARWQRVLRAASRLLDAPRHYGLHPGGVVVSPGPITDFAPCQRAAKGVVVTQFDKHAVEAIGLVKMDLLGNRALTTVDDCVQELARVGIALDPRRIPEDDALTERSLREARTLGCFQVESPGMRNLLLQTGARDMDDVIQAVALIRPGPAASGMKDAYVRRFRGLEDPTPPHPRLTELLWDTHGVMLYQEDVMQAASLVAGLDLAEADLLRRALQKKRHADLLVLEERFLANAVGNGIDAAGARRVWALASNFASFAFCKAHAVTYGRLAYRTVFLKTHYPAAYLAAFLASETGYYEPRVYIEEARRLGVPILAPDVNKSAATYTVAWTSRLGTQAAPGSPPMPPAQPGAGPRPCGAIRVGLGQIKGLSERSLTRILDGRTAGPYLSLTDFLERTGTHTHEAEALIRAGAFDSFDRTRPELFWRLHLLRHGKTHAPRDLARELDLAHLAACRETPESRERAARRRTASARPGEGSHEEPLPARLPRPPGALGAPETGGWSRRGLGLGQAELGFGETASLFPEPETPGVVLPGLPDWDARTRALCELEILGFPLGAHPTRLFSCAGEERAALCADRVCETPNAEPREAELLRPVNRTTCASLERFIGGRITLCGWLAASRRVRTKDGQTMRFLTLEDESGLAEIVLFPHVYRTDGHRLVDRGPFLVTGIVEDQMGSRTLHAERIW